MTLPPAFFFSSVLQSSRHWYISTLRVSAIAVAATPNVSSVRTSFVSALPETWTSRPSIPGSTFSADSSETQAFSPSSRDFAVFTEFPSFQKRTGKPSTKRPSPTMTPLIELPRREPHDSVVVSVTAMTDVSLSFRSSRPPRLPGGVYLIACAPLPFSAPKSLSAISQG